MVSPLSFSLALLAQTPTSIFLSTSLHSESRAVTQSRATRFSTFSSLGRAASPELEPSFDSPPTSTPHRLGAGLSRRGGSGSATAHVLILAPARLPLSPSPSPRACAWWMALPLSSSRRGPAWEQRPYNRSETSHVSALLVVVVSFLAVAAFNNGAFASALPHIALALALVLALALIPVAVVARRCTAGGNSASHIQALGDSLSHPARPTPSPGATIPPARPRTRHYNRIRPARTSPLHTSRLLLPLLLLLSPLCTARLHIHPPPLAARNDITPSDDSTADPATPSEAAAYDMAVACADTTLSIPASLSAHPFDRSSHFFSAAGNLFCALRPGCLVQRVYLTENASSIDTGPDSALLRAACAGTGTGAGGGGPTRHGVQGELHRGATYSNKEGVWVVDVCEMPEEQFVAGARNATGPDGERVKEDEYRRGEVQALIARIEGTRIEGLSVACSRTSGAGRRVGGMPGPGPERGVGMGWKWVLGMGLGVMVQMALIG